MTARYAIYYAPQDQTPLAIFGETLLQRSATQLNITLARESLPELDPSLDQFVRSPRHYGFHATLKAPFELAEGQTEDTLCAAVDAFAHQQSTLALTNLQPLNKSGFLALRFQEQPQSIKALAWRCVQAFEPYRAPLSEFDIQRRNPDTLSPHQRENLLHYGYPYVRDAFDFHLTLTSQLAPFGDGSGGADSPLYQAIAWITSLYEKQVTDDPVLDRVAVYRQPDRQSPFTRRHEAVFRDSPAR